MTLSDKLIVSYGKQMSGDGALDLFDPSVEVLLAPFYGFCYWLREHSTSLLLKREKSRSFSPTSTFIDSASVRYPV